MFFPVKQIYYKISRIENHYFEKQFHQYISYWKRISEWTICHREIDAIVEGLYV